MGLKVQIKDCTYGIQFYGTGCYQAHIAFITSRVCGRGNVFIVSVCLSVCPSVCLFGL